MRHDRAIRLEETVAEILKDTGHLSDPMAGTRHARFNELIEEPYMAIRALYFALVRSPSTQIMGMLHELIGQDPVPPEHRGDVEWMRHYWLDLAWKEMNRRRQEAENQTGKEKTVKKYEGGCAVMLDLMELSEGEAAAPHYSKLRIAAARWFAPELVEDNFHLTLQFVGRDLASQTVAGVIVSSFTFADEVGPIAVEFTGGFEVLRTKKGTYLVALVEPTTVLREAREKLAWHLHVMGVTPKDAFAFKPHVTLVELDPGQAASAPPAPIDRFTVHCRELVVKYGRHRMAIEL